MVETVLAYIQRNNQYLLLYRNKKKNDINEGKWIGVGGHVEKGETPEDALIREIKEETSLDVLEYSKRGIVYFINNNISEVMHLYVVNKVKGSISECDEGELRYVDIDKMNQLPMWEGDKIFLQYIKENHPYFELELIYDGDELKSSKLVKY